MSVATVDLIGVLNAKQNVSGGDRQVMSDERDNLLIAQGLPRYTEMSRRGTGWQVMNTSALAAVVVRPSTVAGLTLWNGETAGGKSYILDRAFAHNLVGVANSSYGIWLCLHPAGMTKPTADITAIKGNYGLLYSGNAIVDTGATVLDNGWFPWSDAGHAVTITVPGGQIIAMVEGRLIVPPQGGVSIQVVADTTAATFTHGFHWYEERLTLAA